MTLTPITFALFLIPTSAIYSMGMVVMLMSKLSSEKKIKYAKIASFAYGILVGVAIGIFAISLKRG